MTPGLRLFMQAARAGRLGAAAGCLAALLAGMPAGGRAQGAEPATPPSSAVAPAASMPAAPRALAPWALVIEAPEPLDRLLGSYLDVARFQHEFGVVTVGTGAPPQAAAAASAVPAASAASATGGAPEPPATAITRGELRRLVAGAPAQVKKLLQTEGYFAPVVQASLDNGPPLTVRIKVEPGPRAQVREVGLLFEGDLDTAFERRDPHAVATQADVRRNWGLPEGSPFRQEDWTTAKNGAMARLRAQGYPNAAWSGTSASVDAKTQEAKLFLVADSGPLFRFGAVKVEGLQYVPESAVHHVQPFGPGDIYSDQALFDYQERLQKLGVFDNVSVAVDPDPSKAQAAPVTVQLHELPRRQATFGAGVSANTGPRVSMEVVDRALWGLGWQGKGLIELGRLRTNVQADFSSYPLEGRRRNLVSAGATRLEASGTVTTSERLRLGRARDGERVEHTVYAEWQRAQVREGEVVSQASSITGNYLWVWRHVDNILLPTSGFAASIETGVGRSFAAAPADGVFTRELARVVGYLPLPGNWYATARADAGGVQAAPDVGVPDTLLFRAGGDESVRGYGYRTLGPDKNGVAVGGRAMVSGSVEVARPISKRLAAWWVAGFIDAGDAALNASDLKLKIGYGVGVRWRSPVGPLRLDLAYGEDRRQFRLHFSVGTTF